MPPVGRRLDRQKGFVMAIKNFTIPENQVVWELYYANAMKDIPVGDNETISKKKVSLAQYKSGVIDLESHINKPFMDITAKDLTAFAESTSKKSKLSHVNAFLLTCVSNGYIQNHDTEFLISLFPKEYRIIGRMIAGTK